MLRVTFGYPSAGDLTGGVAMLYEFANALSRRGNQVDFVHGPAWPTLVTSLDELPEICFRADVRHHLVDSLDDPGLPDGDVFFSPTGPARLGHPCIIMQGYGLFEQQWDDAIFRFPAPKVCVAKWLVDVGTTLGVPSEQLVHVPLGIDHSIFRVETPFDQRVVDVAGLYHPHAEKGWPVLLEALRRLAAERTGFSGVVFARDRPPDELPPGVEFISSPNHRQLAREVYGRSRIMMQASQREGFGLTPVEAMACGAALVTTDNGGSRDYGVDGVTARVVEANDPAALFDAVADLLDDDAERIRLARAGVEHVAQYDWDVSGELLESFLLRYVADPERFRRRTSGPDTT